MLEQLNYSKEVLSKFGVIPSFPHLHDAIYQNFYQLMHFFLQKIVDYN